MSSAPLSHSALSGVKGIVLDVDDTLYLERDYARSGFHAVGTYLAEKHKVSGFGEVAWTLFLDGARGTIFNQALAELDSHTEIDIKELVRVYRGHAPTIERSADADPFISAAKEHFRLFALTGGPPDSQRQKVAALKVESFAEHVVYARAWGAEFDKPHRRSFDKLERLSGLSGAELVYIGDNPVKDFVSPREMGWRSIRIKRSGSLHEDVATPAYVDAEITSLTDLL